MTNLRILHDNAADRAVLSVSSQAGTLGPANLQRDSKSFVLRATGAAQTRRHHQRRRHAPRY